MKKFIASENEKMSKTEFLKRLNYFVDLSALSKYEISLRLGNNDNYMSRVLTGKNNIDINKFFDILDVLEISTEEFFYPDYKNYNKDKPLIELLLKLNNSEKESLMTIFKNK